MSETETIVAQDEWRTIKRVLPRDVYLELIRFEGIVGTEIGSSVSLGASVEIWSVLTSILRDHEEEIRQAAREWKGEAEHGR